MIPAATLEAMRAEATPIYGQAADAVTVDLVMSELVLEALANDLSPNIVLHYAVTDGCGECWEAGVQCFTGETPVRSGGGRVVYPLSVQCDPGTCEDCDEVRP